MTKAHFIKAKIRNKDSAITSVLDEDGLLHTNPKGMATAANSFWEKIFAKKSIDQHAKHEVLNSIDTAIPLASQTLLNQPDHEFLSLEKIKNSIESESLNKSPGQDGLPNEFYEALIPKHNGIILNFLQDVFIQSKREKRLPTSMRKIAIRLIFKYDDESKRKYQMNYRPISLLSCDYKILSRILQSTLNPHMKFILYDDQFCAPNKQIGELILFISSVMDYSEINKLNAAIAFLDFTKAFDSVSHEFIFDAMSKVGIPDNFISWTKLGFIETKASLIMNGTLTPSFELTGGGRQGDNLFPLLFTIVVQALAALIHKSQATGLNICGIKALIKQYADDTTLFIGHENDWTLYQNVIIKFCLASGMEINWLKSMFLNLGNWNRIPPYLPPQLPPQLQLIPDGQETRVLGVYMGTNSPIQSATLRMQAKLHKTLTSKIRKCGNQIGDTLTVNSLLLSQTIFNTRVEFVSKKAHTTANKLGRQFIRGTNYLMTTDQRHAAKEHGTLTPLINQEHLATTLQATWFFQILTHTNPKDRPIFSPIWLHYIPQIIKKHSFRTLDHFINSSINFNKITIKQNKHIPAFLHQSLLQFCTLGFSRQIPIIWEELMNQPIFNNKQILNPTTNLPWTIELFPQISSYKLYRIMDLFLDFDFNQYTRTPRTKRFLHPDCWINSYNTHFSTPTKHLNIPLGQWTTLLNSIPALWIQTLMKGNSTLYPNEFLVHPPPDESHSITLGDIYQHLPDGTLQYYQFVDKESHPGLITKSGLPRKPGQKDHTSLYPNIPFPPYKELRRILTYLIDEATNTWQISSHTLPDFNHSETFQHNILFGQYQHNLFPNEPYKTLTKKWRMTLYPLPERNLDYINRITALGFPFNPHVGLRDVMRSINNSLIPPEHKQMLWLFINQALYTGSVAHNYQTKKKHVNPTLTNIIVPPTCIFTLRTTNVYTEATYQHIFWDSPQATHVWKHISKILTSIHLKLDITSPYQIPLILLPNLSTTPDLKTLARQQLILTAMYTLYTAEKELLTLHQNNEVNLTKLQYWPNEVFHKLETRIHLLIQLTPTLQSELQKREQIPNSCGKPVRKYAIRKTYLHPPPSPTITNLTTQQIELYQQFWTLTHLLSIQDNKLFFQHHNHYPP